MGDFESLAPQRFSRGLCMVDRSYIYGFCSLMRILSEANIEISVFASQKVSGIL